MDKRGQVKIADFGLAKLIHRTPAEYTLTGTRQVMGTLDYMAPEQRSAPQEVDHRADIYSLGVVLYEMLTGDLPIGRFAPPSQKAAVDERFDAVVFRALEREPDRRYQRISDVQIAVESLSRAAKEPAAAGHAGADWPADLGEELVQLRVKAPAAGLLIVAIVILIEALAFLLLMPQIIFSPGAGHLVVHWSVYVVVALVGISITGTMICGAVQMARLESYGLVRATIILAMLPLSYHAVIGIPIGIWALGVLSDSKVKAAFALNLRRSKMARQGYRNQWANPKRRKPTGPVMGMLLGLGRDGHAHRPSPHAYAFLGNVRRRSGERFGANE